MSDVKFTSGVWFACCNSFDVAVLNADGFTEKLITYTGTDDVPSYVEAEANQHLISSSPDMYAMLKECVQVFSSDNEYMVNEINSLLAKARGER